MHLNLKLKMIYKIPHLFEAITEYLKTEKGKQDLMEYVIENDLLDKELIKEMQEYENNHPR